jgi:hypothetical protein
MVEEKWHPLRMAGEESGRQGNGITNGQAGGGWIKGDL